MKILAYALISTLLFIFGWCEDDACEDTKLKTYFNAHVYFDVKTDVASASSCEGKSVICKVRKGHCGGGLSGSYEYNYEIDGNGVGVRTDGIGHYHFSMENEKDWLDITIYTDVGTNATIISPSNIIASGRLASENNYNITVKVKILGYDTSTESAFVDLSL